MRICVIGNSHVAAIKQAWAAPDHPEHTATFFAGPGNSMARLELHEGALAACRDDRELERLLKITSGGDGVIRPGEFDLFVVYGLHFRIPRLDARLSGQVIAACCAGSFDHSTAGTIAGVLKTLSSAPILIGPTPLATRVPRPSEGNPAALVPYDTIISSLEAHCATRGYRLLPQPRATVTEDLRTRAIFNKGARVLRSGTEYSDADFRHMNADFGKLVVADLLRMTRDICPPTPLS